MHHGPMLVATEAAALQASEAVGVTPTGVEVLSTRLLKAAKVGPFRTRAEVVAQTASTAACRAELYDVGAASVVATTFVTVATDHR